jgi:hypothetical protein
MRKLLIGAILTGFFMTVLAFAGGSREATAADGGGKNLKVLPATMTKAEIKKLMKGIADSLGVQCDHCHNTDDMSQDTKMKEKARDMMKMTAEINKAHFAGKDRVKCVTCHNGNKEPK